MVASGPGHAPGDQGLAQPQVGPWCRSESRSTRLFGDGLHPSQPSSTQVRVASIHPESLAREGGRRVFETGRQACNLWPGSARLGVGLAIRVEGMDRSTDHSHPGSQPRARRRGGGRTRRNGEPETAGPTQRTGHPSIWGLRFGRLGACLLGRDRKPGGRIPRDDRIPNRSREARFFTLRAEFSSQTPLMPTPCGSGWSPSTRKPARGHRPGRWGHRWPGQFA